MIPLFFQRWQPLYNGGIVVFRQFSERNQYYGAQTRYWYLQNQTPLNFVIDKTKDEGKNTKPRNRGLRTRIASNQNEQKKFFFFTIFSRRHGVDRVPCIFCRRANAFRVFANSLKLLLLQLRQTQIEFQGNYALNATALWCKYVGM